jgi:hypothetical protein
LGGPLSGHSSPRSPATARLRQCERNCADGHKHKQVKRASNKMRFGGGINLLFHFGVVLVRILIFPGAKLYFGSGRPFLARSAEKCQYFSNISPPVT